MNTINPLWTAYNNAMNEGGEGFNPHPKHIESGSGEPLWSILEGKAAKVQRIMNGTSESDPRFAALKAEYKILKAAQADAMARNV